MYNTMMMILIQELFENYILSEDCKT